MDLNVVTIGIGLFVVLVVFVLLRGVVRIVLGTAVLCISAWVAFRVWQTAPTLSQSLLGKPIDWLSTGLPIGAFLGTFAVGRFLIRLLTSRFKTVLNGEKKPLTMPRLVFTGLIALLPAGMLSSIAGVVMHHVGSIEEIRSSAAQKPVSSQAQLFAQVKSLVDRYVPTDWLKMLDPLSDPSRLALAKLIASKSQPSGMIDPATGRPVPRAIPVDDAELDGLATSGDYATLMHSPNLTKALANPQVKNAVQNFRPH